MRENTVNKRAAAMVSLGSLGLFIVSGCARDNAPELLLESQGDPVQPHPFYDDPHLRHRVYINPNVFEMQFGDKVRLNLPDGRSYLVVRQPPQGQNQPPQDQNQPPQDQKNSAQTTPSDAQRWEGVIHEPGTGKAVLESHKGSLSGEIITPTGQYRIVPEPNGGRLIEIGPEEKTPAGSHPQEPEEMDQGKP